MLKMILSITKSVHCLEQGNTAKLGSGKYLKRMVESPKQKMIISIPFILQMER